MKTGVLAVAAVAGLAMNSLAQFQYTYGGVTNDRHESVVYTSDGGYVAAGSRDVNGNLQMYVVKVDGAGLVQWERTFGGAGRDMANRIEEIPASAGGGYIVAGETSSSSVGFGATLSKLTASGALSWTRAYTGTPFVGGTAGPTGLTVTSNGNFVLANRLQFGANAGQGFVITRTDAFGNVIFSKVYQDARYGNTSWSSFTDVHELAADRSLVLTGFTSRMGDPNTETVVVRVDAGGTLIYARQIGIAQIADFGTNLVPGPQNTLFVTGQWQAATSTNSSYLFRTDLNANVAWYRTYRNFLSNNALEVADSSGSVVIGGTSAGLANQQAAIMKVGFGGAFQWSALYGGTGTEVGETIDVTPTGLLVLDGNTTSWGSGANDAYLIEATGAGDTGETCQELYQPPQGELSPPPVEFQLIPSNRLEYQSFQWTAIDGTVRRDACPTPCVKPPTRMTAWFPFDETSGSISNDIVANNDGTQINGPIAAAGKVAGALCFDGLNDFVTAPDNASIDVGQGDISIDAWIRTTSTAGLQIICDKREQTASLPTRGYSFYISSGQLGFQLADASGTNNFCSCTLSASCTNWGAGAPGFVADGNWHLVAVTVQRNSVTGGKFFVDGVQVGTFDPTCRQGNLDNSSPLTVGRRSFSSTAFFNGCIDELEIFKRVLTPTEVAGLYAAGAAGKCKDTVVTGTNVGFCANELTKTTTATIYNNHATAQTYVGAFSALPAGPGCTVAGPTTIVTSTSFPVTIPANSSLSIPVTITRPAGWTAAGQTACYEFTATNTTSGETLVAAGTVVDRRNLCITFDPFPSGINLRVPFGIGSSTAFNVSADSRGFAGVLKVEIFDDAPSDDGRGVPNDAVSINGLAPGQPLSLQTQIPQGGTESFELFLQLEREEVLTPMWLVISGDTDGDGVPEVLSSAVVEGSYPPVCVGDFNRDGSTDGDDVITFFSAWDTQDPFADVNQDGGVDGDDVISFFVAWDAGC
jgi:hypothetical protein